MSWDGLWIFAIAFLVLAVTPGPGVAATVGQVLSHGIGAVPVFAAGIFLGDVVWYTLAATGFSALAATHENVVVAVRWLGATYLAWLAFQLWTQGGTALFANPSGVARRPLTQLASGLALTLSNPKSIVFFVAVLPALTGSGTVTLQSYVAGLAVLATIVFFVLGAYALAAHWARSLFSSAAALRLLNRTTAAALFAAAAAIALKS